MGNLALGRKTTPSIHERFDKTLTVAHAKKKYDFR